ncbi:MAG: HAMP domain-containing histidine kinase, partial [Clostridia bacterium]|nr:HAMP domain-containing histidine kinase [Clostridia bacterium]
TAIGGWAETIESDLSDTQTATAGLEIIKKETRRLSQMVEELLDFSRIESGRLRLQTELFDLRGILYDAVFTYNDMLRQNGLEILYHETPDPVMVVGDRNRLKQVFLNVIDNAGKYGKDGDSVDISIVAEGRNAVVRVVDHGVGIPEDELPFVKEKFFKGSAKGRGAGIGLAVCNEIITLHEGTLDVASVYGEGTEIIITIPAETGESVTNL